MSVHIRRLPVVKVAGGTGTVGVSVVVNWVSIQVRGVMTVGLLAGFDKCGGMLSWVIEPTGASEARGDVLVQVMGVPVVSHDADIFGGEKLLSCDVVAERVQVVSDD